MEKTQRRLILSIFNTVGFVGTVVVNTLAATLPLNNKNTGELSDQYPNLFVPAGLTFSIWGVIYLLLAVFIVYQLISAIRRKENGGSFIDGIGVLFFVSSLANCGWIFAWHFEVVPLSLVLMLVLLGSLIAIYQRLQIGRSDAPATEKYLVHLTFSLYLGWITVATVANATALLVDIGWGRFGMSEPLWTILVMAVAAAITLVLLFQRRDIFHALVVDWAFLGILLKRRAEISTAESAAAGITGTAVAAQSRPVVIAAVVGLSLISVGIITQLTRKKVYRA